jgi:hypothetical protein
MPTQRQHMKELLAKEEAENKLLFKSLLSTLKPLMAVGAPETKSETTEARRAQSKNFFVKSLRFQAVEKNRL